MEDTLKTLSRSERMTLDNYESTIERNFRNFMNAGTALAAIRDSSLFREEYSSLEEYCLNRWNMGHTPQDSAPTEPITSN